MSARAAVRGTPSKSSKVTRQRSEGLIDRTDRVGWSRFDDRDLGRPVAPPEMQGWHSARRDAEEACGSCRSCGKRQTVSHNSLDGADAAHRLHRFYNWFSLTKTLPG